MNAATCAPTLAPARPQPQPGRSPKQSGRRDRGWGSECCDEDGLRPIGWATLQREICHAHHLDNHHWVHRGGDRKVRHARRQQTLRIHSYQHSWDSRGFFGDLFRPSDRLVSRGPGRWTYWSSGRGDNCPSDLGVHCWPPPVSLAFVDGFFDPRRELLAS